MFLLGYDIGSSSIKATLLEAESGKVVASCISPQTEMQMISTKPGWAEQEPEIWWQHVINATEAVKSQSRVDPSDIKAIGISYQMHGLVVVDKNPEVLRPSIIWCDGRAVAIGDDAFNKIGEERCLRELLNSPGNFTASKLKWVMEKEPEIYSQIHKMMLPGDYIAMKMTGEVKTTASGLSEGIFWDFQKAELSDTILNHYGISDQQIPEIVHTFSIQGELTTTAAKTLELNPGTKISYRAGDQPNNAFSLNVLNPGEIAATAGTSGVVYGIIDQPNYDPQSRVNTFVHVNHKKEVPRYGVLLCINGTGILNSWLKYNFTGSDKELSYKQINQLASNAPIGSEGLVIMPYGNGAERSLENQNINASIHGLNFNVHSRDHIFRAAQEGICFAMKYGVDIMREMGLKISVVKAGYTNMFLSPIFANTFASITGAMLELFETDGSQGAARGAGLGAGIYRNYDEAFVGLNKMFTIEPKTDYKESYQEAYQRWLEILIKQLGKEK